MSYSIIQNIDVKNEDGTITISSLIQKLNEILEEKGDLEVNGGYDNGIWEITKLIILCKPNTDEEILLININ